MDKTEFKHAVLVFSEKLFRVSLRLLEDKEEAKDTLQEVYLKLWNLRDSLNNYRSIEGLAVQITKNLCLDKIRKRNTRRKFNHDDYIEMFGNNQMSADTKMELEDEISQIKSIFEVLPEQQKLVVQLKDIEGYENEEIAEILNTTPNNIRVLLSRGRQKIREILVKELSYGIR